MLVLSRKETEEIVFETPHGRVTIGVASIRGNKVQIAIAAPREVVVHRREVAERIDRARGSGET